MNKRMNKWMKEIRTQTVQTNAYLFWRTHSMQIFGEIPFVKPQKVFRFCFRTLAVILFHFFFFNEWMNEWMNKTKQNKIKNQQFLRPVSGPVCKNSRSKVTKTPSWVLPFCVRQSVSVTSWTRSVCAPMKQWIHRPVWFCSPLFNSKPIWLRPGELNSKQNKTTTKKVFYFIL